MPIIQAMGRQKQEDREFEVSLDAVENPRAACDIYGVYYSDVCLGIMVSCAYKYPQRLEEDVGSPGIGITYGCLLP